MKKKMVATVAFALFAQLSFAGNIGLFGSYWDTKEASDAFGGGVKLKMDMGQAVYFELRGSYFEFDDEVEGVKATLDVIPAEAGFIFLLVPGRQAFRPYAGGGVGYYFMEAKVSVSGTKESLDIDDEMGYYAVAGAEFSLNRSVSLFAEAKYTWLKIKKVEELKTDTKLDGFGANVGLLLSF